MARERSTSASAAPEPPEADAAGLPPTRRLQTRAGLLEYRLSGEGDAAIVLLAGAGLTIDSWAPLYPGIERLGRVFAWNRFGLSGSAEPPPVQRGAVIVASVRELMAYAGLEPPYLLVGHSLGGLYANLFARLHPREVGGVLFLEATHPRDEAQLPQDRAKLAQGLAKVQGEPASQFESNLHAEVDAAGETVQEVQAAGPFPAVPVTVITGGMAPPLSLLPPEAAAARRRHQSALARLSSDAEHVVAQASGHFPQRSEPQLVLDALGRLIERVRRRG